MKIEGGLFKTFIDTYKILKADKRKKAQLRRWVRNGMLDYQLLQELVNACPQDVEMKIGPLQDGTTITLRRIFDPQAQARAIDYRTKEQKFEQWIEELKVEARI